MERYSLCSMWGWLKINDSVKGNNRLWLAGQAILQLVFVGMKYIISSALSCNGETIPPKIVTKQLLVLYLSCRLFLFWGLFSSSEPNIENMMSLDITSPAAMNVDRIKEASLVKRQRMSGFWVPAWQSNIIHSPLKRSRFTFPITLTETQCFSTASTDQNNMQPQDSLHFERDPFLLDWKAFHHVIIKWRCLKASNSQETDERYSGGCRRRNTGGWDIKKVKLHLFIPIN